MNLEGLLKGEIAEPLKNLRVTTCRGSTTFIPVDREPRNLGWEPASLVLGDGMLTWDTGHSPGDYESEATEQRGEGSLRHGILASYNLHTHNRRIWRLPLLTLNVTRHHVDGIHVIGIFGYSTHTAYDVLWMAARSASCTYGETGCWPEDEVSSIYAAHL